MARVELSRGQQPELVGGGASVRGLTVGVLLIPCGALPHLPGEFRQLAIQIGEELFLAGKPQVFSRQLGLAVSVLETVSTVHVEAFRKCWEDVLRKRAWLGTRSAAPGFRHLGANRDPPQAEPQPPARRRTPATRPSSGGEPNPLTRLKMRLFDQADV